MSARLSRTCAGRDVPWGNGLGISREVAASHEPGIDAAPGKMRWRISTTAIPGDCDFSHYPGYRRTIVLTEGHGFSLDFGVHGAASLKGVGDRCDFDGGWATTCALVDGPVQVLNVMSSATLAQFGCQLVHAVGTGIELGVGPSSRALYCATGGITVRLLDEVMRLGAGECLKINCASEATLVILERDSPALALLLVAPD